MKKLFLLLLLVAPAFGQTFSGYSGADTFVLPPWRFCMGDDPGAHNACFTQSTFTDQTAFERGHLDYQYTIITISKLPSATTLVNKGRVYWVSDGSSAADCSAGGGFNFVLCVSNGAIWVPIGGGGGGGSSNPFLLRTNSPNCTTLNQLVEYDIGNLDTNGVATVQNASASSKKVIGVVISGAGCSGIATIGTYLSAQCVSDGQTVVGDLISSSASAAGQCDDYGATISASVQTVGRVSKANTGSGTLSQVDFFLGDLLAPGSNSGSGTVSNCGSGNSVAYYATAGTSVNCDPSFTDNGAGNPTAKSLGLTGAGAGFLYLTQGAAPTVSAVNSIYFYAPVSVSSYAWILPGTAGTGCLQGANSGGLVTISFTGSNCLSGTTTHGLSFTLYNAAGLSSGTTTASATYLTVPFGCTIQAYNLAIDAGTITVKFWKVATGTAIPTSGNSISTSGVSISSGTAIHSTTLSDFTTTTVAANDIMAMDITAVATATFVNGVLQCQ